MFLARCDSLLHHLLRDNHKVPMWQTRLSSSYPHLTGPFFPWQVLSGGRCFLCSIGFVLPPRYLLSSIYCFLLTRARGQSAHSHEECRCPRGVGCPVCLSVLSWSFGSCEAVGLSGPVLGRVCLHRRWFSLHCHRLATSLTTSIHLELCRSSLLTHSLVGDA